MYNSVLCKYLMCHVHSYLLQSPQTSASFPPTPNHKDQHNDNLARQIYKHRTPSATLPHTKITPAYSATSRYFHLPLHYEDRTIMMNVSWGPTNINAINVSTLDFRILQHFSSNWTPPHLQKLANVSEGQVTQLYKHLIDTSEPVHSFTIKDDDKHPSTIWTILTHHGTYIGTIVISFSFVINLNIIWLL